MNSADFTGLIVLDLMNVWLQMNVQVNSYMHINIRNMC